LSRLYLITPSSLDIATFPAALEAALQGGEVASLLIATEASSDMAFQRIAEVLTPIGQAAGAAVMVANDTRAAGRAKADGVHVENPAELADALKSFQPRNIVGAGGIKTRHDAMTAAEGGADYVFFGLLDKPEGVGVHERTLEFAEWWMPLFETPCVALAGSDMASIDALAATGADFIAVRDVIWNHPEGPGAAIAEAVRRIAAADVEAGA
jgi:thiamine-phosphate pyrophosphorylase